MTRTDNRARLINAALTPQAQPIWVYNQHGQPITRVSLAKTAAGVLTVRSLETGFWRATLDTDTIPLPDGTNIKGGFLQ